MALNLVQAWKEIVSRARRTAAGQRRTRPTSVTALDLDGDTLHVVQAALRAGQPRVVRRAALPLDRPAGSDQADPTSIGKAISAALTRARLSPGAVVMGIPHTQVVLRTLELPPVARTEETAAMVHLRMGRDLPFSLNEAVIDFSPVTGNGAPRVPADAVAGQGRSSSGGALMPTRALTAVVRRKSVEHLHAVARAAGGKLVGLGLRSLAGARAAATLQPEAATGCVGLVTLRAHEVSFDVLLEGTLLFSRAGSWVDGRAAATQPTDPESNTPRDQAASPRAVSGERNPAVIEVARSLHSYEGTPGHVPLDRILVAGDSGTEGALAADLASQLGMTVRVLEPMAEPGTSLDSPGSLVPALPAVGLAMSVLDPRGMPFDFLHPKRPPVVRDTRRLRQLAGAVGVLALLFTAGGLRARWIGERERHRAALQEQVNLGSKNLGAYRLARNQARMLKEWTGAGRDWLDHLSLLSALLPPSRELYVSSLSTSARNTLSLAVRVRSGETVDRLTATLRAAGYDVKAPAIMPATDRYGFRFQANLELEVPVAITNNLDELVVESRGSESAGSTESPAPQPPPAPAPLATNPAPPAGPAPDRPGAASPDRASVPDPAPAMAPSASSASGEVPPPENRRRGLRRPRPQGGSGE